MITMKKVLLFVFICMSVPVLHAQICDEEDLSLEGLAHYKKAIEYSKNLTSGTHDKALAEWERVIRTDSLWCDEVYKRTGILCEYLYANKKPTGQIVYRDKAIRYYRTYLAFNPSDKDIIGRLSELESQSDINKNSINNSVKIEMVYVEGMLNEDTTDCVHSFYMGKYEVTQAQWESVMGSNPSHFKGPNLPVENISYVDAQLFISELNRLTGNQYRLPTEKEWEYAKHGGKAQEKYTYSGGYSAEKVGWVETNSMGRTHAVGEKEPNSLGIYDMTGNVSEMCSDRDYLENFHGGSVHYELHYDERDRPYYIKLVGSNWARGGEFYVRKEYYNGIRLLLPVDSLSSDEQNWDTMILYKKAFIYQAIHKKIKRQSYLPIIQFGKGFEGNINAGFALNERTPYVGLTIIPGPFYMSALLSQDTSLYLSAGLSFDVINRFGLNVGAAYHLRDNAFGADIGVTYSIVSVGVTLFQHETIPHVGISGLVEEIVNSDYIYGYDIKNNAFASGFSLNYSNMYTGFMYQMDTSFHVMAGVNLLPIDNFSIHAGLAYNNLYGIGFDAGIRYAGLGVGVLKYKEYYVPTIKIGQGLEGAWDYHIASMYGYDYKNGAHAFGLSGSVDFIYATALYQTDNNYYLALGGFGSAFESRALSFKSGIVYSRYDSLGMDFGLAWGFDDEEEANISAGVFVFKDKLVPTIGLGGTIGWTIIGTVGLIAGLVVGSFYLAS